MLNKRNQMQLPILPDSGIFSYHVSMFFSLTTDHCLSPAFWPFKLFSLSFLYSRLFLHDFTAERGVFWPGGHCTRSAARGPEGTAWKVFTAKNKDQKCQREHKTTVPVCEKACTSSCAQRWSVRYDSNHTSKQWACLFRCVCHELRCFLLCFWEEKLVSH